MRSWRDFLVGALCGAIVMAAGAGTWVWWRSTLEVDDWTPVRSAEDAATYDMCLASGKTTIACDAVMRLLARDAAAEADMKQVVPTKVGRQTEYAGLRLGMTQDEVMYVKGNPPYVLADEPDSQWKGFMRVIDTKNLEEGKRAIDYSDWGFRETLRHIDVTFNPARTAVTIIQCTSDDKGNRCPALGGVRDGDSEKEVLRKLGNPTSSKIDGVTKQMSYRDLNIEIWLTKERVYMLALRDPSHQR